MKHIQLLERVLIIFQNLHNFISMKEVLEIWKEIAHLQKDIEIYLDNYYADEDIEETLYEELDSRMQVVERFLDTIQTIGNKDFGSYRE